MIQKTAIGPGKLRELPALTEKLQIRHPLLVAHDRSAAMLMKRFPALSTCPVFSAFHENPDLEDCAPGAELYRRENCDGLISVGGGSCMDTAKAILARMSAETMEDVKASRLTDRGIPHIAVPTTAGTGSEATQTAVNYVGKSKLSISHPCLLPQAFILDGELLQSLPPYQKKAGAMDALAQGIESWWSKASTEDSRVHAYLAILGVLDNLPAYLNGDPHAAQLMLEAACQSGRAIQITRTTAAHAMSYRLTKDYGMAHGHACMLTLPVLWDCMNSVENMEPVLTSLASAMRLGSPLLGPGLLWGLLYDLDLMPDKMPDEEALQALADAVNTERLGNHPVPLTNHDLRAVYRRAFAKKTPAEKQACLDIWKYYGMH